MGSALKKNRNTGIRLCARHFGYSGPPLSAEQMEQRFRPRNEPSDTLAEVPQAARNTHSSRAWPEDMSTMPEERLS